MNERMSEAMREALIAPHQSIAVVASLLADGEDVDARDVFGRTALFHAVARPNAALCRLLLLAGADANAVDEDGQSVLARAAELRGNRQVASLLIEAGANVNGRSRDGVTALMSAVTYGSRDVVQELLNAGAEIAPERVLTEAWRRGDHEITRLLEDHGARYSIALA